MTFIFDYLGPRLSGIILMAIGGVLLILTIFSVWGSVSRWEGADSIESYHLNRLSNNEDQAIKDAKRAAAVLDREAVTVIPSINLESDSDLKLLDELLSRRLPPAQRADIETVQAFSRTLRGQASPQKVGGSDGILIAHLQTFGKEGAPSWPNLQKSEPPHASILLAALRRQFAAVWLAGDAKAIQKMAGALMLAEPLGQDANRLRFLLAAMTPKYEVPQLTPLAGLIANLDERIAFIRQLCLLAPERRAVLTALIPVEKKLPNERNLLPSEAVASLETKVKFAVEHPKEEAFTALIPRCVQEGRIDLAKSLITYLRTEIRPPFEIAIATAEGDLSTVLRLCPNQSDLVPRISPPVLAAGSLSFHLSTDSGFVARSPVTLIFGNRLMATEKVKRFGSLFALDVGDAKSGTLEVRIGSRVIFAGQVGP
jgi:hypothetical protein